MASNREIRILADANSIAQTAAAEFLEAARESVREKGSFSLALAGGSTPKALYVLHAGDPFLQDKVPRGKHQFSFAMNGTSPPTTRRATFAWPRKRCSPRPQLIRSRCIASRLKNEMPRKP